MAQDRTEPGAARRYFEEVVMTYDGDECLIWPFGRNGSGYAQISPVLENGKRTNRKAHRVICERVNGPPPTPKHAVAHTCGKGASGCVAKRHVKWKTQGENEVDKIIHGTSSVAKLTVADVIEIRAIGNSIPRRAIAKRYSITRRYIRSILRRETWAWLDDGAAQ